MKIRRKPQHGIISAQSEYEVIDEGEVWYVALDRSQPVVLRKEFYEPIPEVTWRDVTAACEVRVHRGEPMIFHNDGPHVQNVHCRRDEYRIRKVGMKELHDLWRGQDCPYAFIIEKKESTNGE